MPIQVAAFSLPTRPTEITSRIHKLTAHLKEQLYAFVRDFQIELLVVQNALAIPMNIPLGIALTELIAETAMPTIAHHHDFFWERKRFLTNCVWDYLNMAFPCTSTVGSPCRDQLVGQASAEPARRCLVYAHPQCDGL